MNSWPGGSQGLIDQIYVKKVIFRIKQEIKESKLKTHVEIIPFHFCCDCWELGRRGSHPGSLSRSSWAGPVNLAKWTKKGSEE